MIEGKTKSGFPFAVNEAIAEDWRLARLVRETQSGDGTRSLCASVDMAELVLGDQLDALQRHVQRDDGIVPAQAVADEIVEILDICKEKSAAVKKS